MGIDKSLLNLAGEYRVAAELLKRGIFAAVTFGNMKGADIIATGPNRRSAVVEVKASNSSRFVTGLFQKYKTRDCQHPTFWVLCAITPGGEFNTERAFVLTHDELALKQGQRNCPGERLSYEQLAARAKKGVDNIRIENIREFENDWGKIVAYCLNGQGDR